MSSSSERAHRQRGEVREKLQDQEAWPRVWVLAAGCWLLVALPNPRNGPFAALLIRNQKSYLVLVLCARAVGASWGLTLPLWRNQK